MGQQEQQSGEVAAILSTVWGCVGGSLSVSQSVFNRWSQGFVFSEDDCLVLRQLHGGPCGVLAPVQAHVFKHMLHQHGANDAWKNLTREDADGILCTALAEILERIGAKSSTAINPLALANVRLVCCRNDHVTTAAASSGGEAASTDENTACLNAFHSSLSICEQSVGESLVSYFRHNLATYRSRHGILLFLYSAIASKGVERVCAELGDSEESLVDAVHGHGSQALTNLLLTGRAVAHVWDDTKHVAGIALEGICEQPEVGFLTVLERLHYCTVGWNLKHPLHPVWILASETHLSVMFSTCRRLVRPATARQLAGRRFDARDPDGAGFVAAVQVAPLLAECRLEHSAEYVDLMLSSLLDPDQLGVVLRSTFLDEFFPTSTDVESGDSGGVAGGCGGGGRAPDSFTLYHCNALAGSNADGKIRLRRGEACLLECIAPGTSATDPLLTCLQCRWPRIDVRWDDTARGCPPSVN